MCGVAHTVEVPLVGRTQFLAEASFPFHPIPWDATHGCSAKTALAWQND